MEIKERSEYRETLFKLETPVNVIEIEKIDKRFYLTTTWKNGNDPVTTDFMSNDEVIEWVYRNYGSIEIVQ